MSSAAAAAAELGSLAGGNDDAVAAAAAVLEAGMATYFAAKAVGSSAADSLSAATAPFRGSVS